MAANYEPLGSYQDVEFLGGTLTRSVTVFRIKTLPHNVYAEMRLATISVPQANINQARSDYANFFESLYGHPGVADVAWSQTTSPAGQLQDQLTIYVESTSGNSSDQITYPMQPVEPDVYLAGAAAAQQRLDQQETS